MSERNELPSLVSGDVRSSVRHDPSRSANGFGPGSSRSRERDEAGVDIGETVGILRRGKWIIAGTTLLIMALVGAYTYTLDPVYEAYSIVRLDTGPQSMRLAAIGHDRDLASEVGVLEYSADLSSRVIEELRKTEDALGETGRFPLLYLADGRSRTTQESMVELAEAVSFRPMPSQGMIEITVESQVPEEASTVANIYVREYETYSREKARAGVVAAREFLEHQADKRLDEIQRLEVQWEAFANSNQVVTQGMAGERLVAEYADLSARRDALEFELEQEREALRLLREQLTQFEPDVRQGVQQEQAASGLRSEIQVLGERIGRMKAEAAQYYVANEGLEGDRERIDREFSDLAEILRRIDGFEKRKRDLTNRLVSQASEMTGVASGADFGEGGASGEGTLGRVATLRNRITEQETRIGQMEAQIGGLDQTIRGYEPRLSQIPQQTIQREALDRKLTQAEAFYQSITAELQRTIIAEESELGYVETVRRAFVPTVPVRPNVRQNVLLSLLLGVGFGVGLVFLREASQVQLQRPDDLVRHGYPVMGIVPDMEEEISNKFRGRLSVNVEGHTLSTRLLPLLSPWSSVTENYRLLRTNLQYSNNGEAYGRAPRTILVTSPEPGDGKTTTAVNLALTFVLGGQRVLLIDADMRRPNAYKLLGMERGPGLAEMLRGEAQRQIVRRTCVDGLYFVPSGTTDDPPTEALHSGRLDKLIELGKSRCDVVIIDTPPVLAASDPIVLAPRADASLVVASADKTSLKALNLTRDMLEGVGVAITGVIFNRFDASKLGDSTYRYGYYSADEYKEYRMAS